MPTKCKPKTDIESDDDSSSDYEEEPNYRDIFKEKSHLEITEWLEKRNLGKLKYLRCHNQTFIFFTKDVICIK